MSTGILLLNKPAKRSSFSLIPPLRRLFNEKKIGHAGTLDPFATGVMVLLIGRKFTQMCPTMTAHDKEYLATLYLGAATDTFDCEGSVTDRSDYHPTLSELEQRLNHFQGTLLQTPPMYSAKKVEGRKLYELARKGITIARQAQEITVSTQLLHYDYPTIELRIVCSKGTYVRSIAHDLGCQLGSFAHLSALKRVRSGPFHLSDCWEMEELLHPDFDKNAFSLNDEQILTRNRGGGIRTHDLFVPNEAR